MSDKVTEVNAEDLRKGSGATGDSSEDGAPGSSYVPALRRHGTMSVDTGSGVVDITGVKPPYLNLVQGVGKLSSIFNPGELVLAGEHLLAARESPLNLVVLKYSQFVKEALSTEDYNSGKYPRVFANKADAEAAGLRTEWGPNHEKPEADFALDMLVLIKKPAKVECGVFGIELGGESYALAMCTFDKMSYKAVASTFLQSVVYAMRGRKVWTGLWELKTRLQVSRTNASNKAWVPSFKLAGFLTDAAKAELEALFGAFLATPIEKDKAAEADPSL